MPATDAYGSPLTTTQRGYGSGWAAICEKVYQRYGYNECFFCHLPIDKTLPHTHRYSRTVHHTLPTNIHGTKLPRIEDCRPAHRSCNSRFGDGTTKYARTLRPMPTSRFW